MKRQPITKLKKIHQGKDIYVLGSGASMGYINPRFFDNKVSIGANSIWKYFPISYSLFKHKQFVEEAVKFNQVTIASLHDCGDLNHPINEDPKVDFVFTHKKLQSLLIHISTPGQDSIEQPGKQDKYLQAARS